MVMDMLVVYASNQSLKTISEYYEANKDKYKSVREVWRAVENGELKTALEERVIRKKKVKVIVE